MNLSRRSLDGDLLDMIIANTLGEDFFSNETSEPGPMQSVIIFEEKGSLGETTPKLRRGRSFTSAGMIDSAVEF